MTEPAHGHVRPTKRCLDDLQIPFPPYTQPLGSLEHPIIKKAQRVPEQVAAGGADRIRTLTDRIWFKAKTDEFRAAVSRLKESEIARIGLQRDYGEWWIGSAGHRKEGRPDDFYESIEAEATRHGKGTGKTNTEFLLPTSIDRMRLEAEAAALAKIAIQNLVCRVIVQSLRHGSPFSVELANYRVIAYIKAVNGTDAYLAISAEGIRDADFLAIILSSVPDISADDWMLEPSDVLGIKPEQGQLIWSTMIPPKTQAYLLDSFDEE